MKRTILISILTLSIIVEASSQRSSFIVLGDTHYDQLEDHDMEWIRIEKPNDLSQIENYTSITKENWNDFMVILKKRIQSPKSNTKLILQLGDLSEGLAGTPEKAQQMAANAIKAIRNTNMPVPWIIAKGNHDVTGPGAKEAFLNNYVPFIKNQTGSSIIKNASYSYKYENVQITCIDPWDNQTDMVAFLDQELSSSNAKYKFVAIHEPVIPVTERCWHTLRKEPERREKLLEVIAKNKAIVLCGHLHRYSVVKRETKFGPIIQIMAISVIQDRNYKKPKNIIREYGPSLAENVPDWQPETLNERKEILKQEADFVTYYKQTDLPGYAIIKIDDAKENVVLEYYAAFGKGPIDIINLTQLAK
jgi:hypothetical protein